MLDLSAWDVLVVDDEPDNRGVLEFVLDSYGATVRAAESAEECLRLMEERVPTLLLTDIQMPGVSGLELLAIVRERPEWRSIPMIAVTAFAMSGDRERILAAGFDGYLAKPLSVMELASDLQALVLAKTGS